MTNLQIVIADSANSNSDELKQAEVQAGTTVSAVLSANGVTVREGQKVSFNGQDVSLSAQVLIGGILAVTGEAKGA
jgi:hypothetical protein